MRNIDGSSYLKNPELDIVETKTDTGRGDRRDVRAVRRPGRRAPSRKPKPAKKPKRRVASSGG